MAGDWIKIEHALPDKPEVMAITEKMGWDDQDLTVGKLIRLFRWFDLHTKNGNADGVTFVTLDRHIGNAGFCECVTRVGWLEKTQSGIRMVNFDYHTGESAKSRAQTAKRAARHRAKKKSNADTVTKVTSACDELRYLEKRREDINTQEVGMYVNRVSSDHTQTRENEPPAKNQASESLPAMETLQSKKNEAQPNLAQATNKAGDAFAPDSEWLELVAHNFPDHDVRGELIRFQSHCAQKSTVANRNGFVGWLKQASPAIKTRPTEKVVLGKWAKEIDRKLAESRAELLAE